MIRKKLRLNDGSVIDLKTDKETLRYLEKYKLRLSGDGHVVLGRRKDEHIANEATRGRS